eukprot:2764125-Pyramimonas_sp.AAC.1
MGERPGECHGRQGRGGETRAVRRGFRLRSRWGREACGVPKSAGGAACCHHPIGDFGGVLYGAMLCAR